MKREIRFRVLDANGQMVFSGKHYDDDLGMFFEQMSPDGEDCMQYTGLKDRHSVEIYELCELNDRYIVTYKAPSFVLYEISSGDIIDINEHDEYEITTEYKPLPQDSKRGAN